jgi:hypothetical protein
VCGALDAAGLAELQRQVGHECFEPGRTIVTEGEVADRGFILLSGMVLILNSVELVTIATAQSCTRHGVETRDSGQVQIESRAVLVNLYNLRNLER